MELKKTNNLVELFFEKYKSQKKDEILLTSLKNLEKTYSWEQTKNTIINLSSEISKYKKSLFLISLDLSKQKIFFLKFF